MKPWTADEVALFCIEYPAKGKRWCMEKFQRSEASIRAAAYVHQVRQDRSSEHFQDWQRRAAHSKVGKKRPDQALVMLALHASGKLKMTEAMKVAIGVRSKAHIAKHGHPRGMLGKKHPPEALLKISAAVNKRYAEEDPNKRYEAAGKMLRTKAAKGILANPRLGTTWKAAWREIGGTRKFYRSRWEANYAHYLEWLKSKGQIADWKHEPKTFWFEGIKRGCRTYLPDFLVKELNGSEAFHEVKGWMDDRSKTKIKRMAIYHPTVKLIVIDSKQYKTLARTVSSLVPGWEV